MNNLISDIVLLVHRINQETTYAAWFDYQGHVQSISVRIALGKSTPDYHEKIASSEVIYLKWNNAIENLTSLHNNLISFLDSHKEIEQYKTIKL